MIVMPAMSAKIRTLHGHFYKCIFYIEGAHIKVSHLCKHLGHLITSPLPDDDDREMLLVLYRSSQ